MNTQFLLALRLWIAATLPTRAELGPVAGWVVDRLKEKSTVQALITALGGILGVVIDPARITLYAGAVSVICTMIAVATKEKTP